MNEDTFQTEEEYVAAQKLRAHPSPTGEKVEAGLAAWRWKGHDGKWVYEEGGPIKRAMREYDGIVVEDLYSSETVAALEAERNEIALHAAVIDEALTNAIQMRKHAEAERDEARTRLKVANEVRVEMNRALREQHDKLAVAEFALATANARVEKLETAATILLSEIDAPGGYEEILMAASSLRAALTGGEDDR